MELAIGIFLLISICFLISAITAVIFKRYDYMKHKEDLLSEEKKHVEELEHEYRIRCLDKKSGAL